MATSTAKKSAAAAPASSKLTVMPLFMDQHGTIDEETGEVIECYAEHCGQILLSDQPLPGSKKPRTLVSYEDFWKAGWETDDDGDSVDPADVDKDEVPKFVIDPFKTTKQHLEEQFGKRYLFAIATWGDGAPEGKSGMMRGSGHSFFTGGDVLKKRGLPVEEPAPKKTRRAPAAANDAGDGDSGEGDGDAAATAAKEALEAAEARVTELEEQMEALRAEMKEAFTSKPQESIASQFKAVGDVINGFGGGRTSGSEQFWQDQIAAARREVSDRERFWNEEVARVRSTAANEASTKVIGYETRLQTLFSEMSTNRTAAVTELAAVHQAQRDDLKRREIAHDTEISMVKTKLTAAEIQLSEFRRDSDTKISELTALLNGHKLLEMKAGIEKNFETEKLARIEKEHGEIKTERDHLKMLNAEQSETIETMRRNLHTPTHQGGENESSGGFTIPRFVWKLIIPALPMIGMLLYKFFSDSGKPMPKEAADWFQRQAANAGAPGADAWAQANYADAAEQERARKEKEWDDNERERLRREEADRVERAHAATAAEAERVEKERVAAAARAEASANERREAEKVAAALVEKQAEASRVEAARIEAERVETAKVAEAARTEAARIEAARVESERAAEALRIAGTPEGRTASDKGGTAPVGTVENPIITPLASESTNGGE